MISAAFLPGCPSALHRVAWLALSNGAIGALPAQWPASGEIATFLPAVIVSALALWVWQTRRGVAAAVVFLLAAAVHPPLALAVAPLLARRDTRDTSRRRAWLRAAIVVGGAGAILWWATPDCVGNPPMGAAALARAIFGTLRTEVGIIAALLAVYQTLRDPRSPLVRTAWFVVAASVTAAIVFQTFDGRVTLAPAALLLWYLAARGAVALVIGQHALTSRVAALALVSLIPVVHLATVRTGVETASRGDANSARALFTALDELVSPATLVSEDATHDLISSIWRSGNQHRHASLQIVDAHSDRTAAALETRALYALDGGARRLESRGFWMGPLAPPPPAAEPLVWRAVRQIACEPLTTSWREVTALAATGQIAAVFSHGGTGRHAIVYAALPRGTAISPLRWAPMARGGYAAMDFDLSSAPDRTLLYETAAADLLSPSMIPTSTGLVARLLIGRLEPTPGSLAVAFGAPVETLMARMDGGAATSTLSLCPSSHDLAVVGHREAPRVAAFDLTSAGAIGRGWHASERVGDVSFRWTSGPDAELRFLAAAPAPLQLQLHILEVASGGSREAVSVALNGVAARCERGSGGDCAWVLPTESVRVGLNILTVHGPVVDSSPRDGRVLGLKITGAELRHLGLTGRDFVGAR